MVTVSQRSACMGLEHSEPTPKKGSEVGPRPCQDLNRQREGRSEAREQAYVKQRQAKGCPCEGRSCSLWSRWEGAGAAISYLNLTL